MCPAEGDLVSPLRPDTTLFLPDEHVALTRNPVFGDNLLFWLLEEPRDPAVLATPDGAGALGQAGSGPDPPLPAGPDR